MKRLNAAFSFAPPSILSLTILMFLLYHNDTIMKNEKRVHPRYGCQSDKDTPLHSFHFQKIKKFVFLKVTSCIYY